MVDRIKKALPSIVPKLFSEKLNSSQMMRRISGGVFWSFLGNITWRLLSAISTIVVARILGPQGFGTFGFLQSTMRMFSVYAAFRLGTTATKYVAEYRQNQPAKAGRILQLSLNVSLLLCSLVSVVFLITSPYLAEFSLKHPELTFALSLCAIQMFFLIYGNVKEYALAGFENFKAIAGVSIIRGVTTPLCSIPLAYFWQIEGLLVGLIIVSVIAFIQLSYFLRTESHNAGFPQRLPLRDLKQEAPVLWRFALPGFLVGVILAITTWSGRLFFAEQDSGYYELGLFEAANQWRTVVLFLPAVLARVFLPILSETYGNKYDSRFHSAVSLQMQTVCMITLPLVVLVIGLSEPLGSIYGKEFKGTDAIIPTLMASVFFYAINQPLRQIYDGTGKRWINLVMHIIWASAFIISSFALIPSTGAIGFAFAHLFSEAILLLTQWLYIDFILAPKILRRNIILFLYSFVLLGSCYFVDRSLSGYSSVLATLTFSGLAVIPIVFKIRGSSSKYRL